MYQAVLLILLTHLSLLYKPRLCAILLIRVLVLQVQQQYHFNAPFCAFYCLLLPFKQGAPTNIHGCGHPCKATVYELSSFMTHPNCKHIYMRTVQDEYVPDPNLVVQNGQTVKVRVQSWDPSKNRLSFTMKPETSSADAGGGGGGGGAGGYLDRQGDRQPRQGKVARAGLLISSQQSQCPMHVCCSVHNKTQYVSAAWSTIRSVLNAGLLLGPQ